MVKHVTGEKFLKFWNILNDFLNDLLNDPITGGFIVLVWTTFSDDSTVESEFQRESDVGI